jgi:hypothetical protein
MSTALLAGAAIVLASAVADLVLIPNRTIRSVEFGVAAPPKSMVVAAQA